MAGNNSGPTISKTSRTLQEQQWPGLEAGMVTGCDKGWPGTVEKAAGSLPGQGPHLLHLYFLY